MLTIPVTAAKLKEARQLLGGRCRLQEAATRFFKQGPGARLPPLNGGAGDRVLGRSLPLRSQNRVRSWRELKPDFAKPNVPTSSS
jgi:hypothetical protein